MFTMNSYIFTTLALASMCLGHMEISNPIPFRSKLNTHAVPATIDYSMTAPLKADGSDFPCKGYQVDMADASGAGFATATYTPGSSASFTWVGGAPHGGGSCQAALSYDQGKTWKVIHSYVGSCPISSGQSFDFTVPADAPGGSAVLGVTWFNHIGNREMYMNCASVKIGGASAKIRKAAPAVAFSARPDLFVANLGNGCTTVEGKDVVFPNPGPDVTTKTSSDNSGSFTGTCAAVKGVGGASGSSNAAPAAPVASSAAPAPAPSSTSVISIEIIPTHAPTATGTASTPAATGAPASALTPSKDGQCGGTQTCIGNTFGTGNCCSAQGFCGSGDAWCGVGCQSAFGQCGTFTNGTSTPSRRSRVYRPPFN